MSIDADKTFQSDLMMIDNVIAASAVVPPHKKATASAAIGDSVVEPPLLPSELDQKGLLNLLKGQSRDVIGLVYELGKRELDAEIARRARLNSKATTMLSAAGVSLTVLTSVGGTLLLKNAEAIEGSAILSEYLGPCLAFAVLVGLVAAALSAAALKVRGYASVSLDHVFQEKKLGRLRSDHNESQSRMLTWMAAHVWFIARGNCRISEGQSKRIIRAQWAYMTFLLSLLAIAAMILVVVF